MKINDWLSWEWQKVVAVFFLDAAAFALPLKIVVEGFKIEIMYKEIFY